MASAALCTLEMQISWQAQHFVNLAQKANVVASVVICEPARAALCEPQGADFVAQRLRTWLPRSADGVAGAASLWISRPLKKTLAISGSEDLLTLDLSLHLKSFLNLSGWP